MSSSAAMEEILDLRGRPAAEQMRAAHEAVERAVGGAGMHILTDLEVVATPDGETPFALRGVIAQENVSDGFRMPLPIRFEYEDEEPQVRADFAAEMERKGIEFAMPPVSYRS